MVGKVDNRPYSHSVLGHLIAFFPKILSLQSSTPGREALKNQVILNSWGNILIYQNNMAVFLWNFILHFISLGIIQISEHSPTLA